LIDYIIDVGMNDGSDTKYYLAKGFNVIAIEANPDLCFIAQKEFSKEIKTGKLRIINSAVHNSAGYVQFYVNMNNTHWSSANIKWASRDNSNVAKISVQTVRLQDIILEYGAPKYIKIDIEGNDLLALQQISLSPSVPKYISVEDCRLGYEYLTLLMKAGYSRFKLSNQYNVPNYPDHEIGYEFKLGDSGLFGDELDGNWLDYESFLKLYSRRVRARGNLVRIAEPHIWWDIHASL